MATQIRHVKQPTDNSCMSAVISMITTIPVTEVMTRYHDRLKSQEVWYDHILRDFQIPHIVGHVNRADLMSGYGHILTVPSLNMAGDFHGILVLWPAGSDQTVILDPNTNRPGKRYYCQAPDPSNPLEYGLVNWRVDVYIPLAEGGKELEIIDAFSDQQ